MDLIEFQKRISEMLNLPQDASLDSILNAVQEMKNAWHKEIRSVGRWCAIHDQDRALLAAVMDADKLDFDDYVKKHGCGPGQAMLAASNVLGRKWK